MEHLVHCVLLLPLQAPSFDSLSLGCSSWAPSNNREPTRFGWPGRRRSCMEVYCDRYVGHASLVVGRPNSRRVGHHHVCFDPRWSISCGGARAASDFGAGPISNNLCWCSGRWSIERSGAPRGAREDAVQNGQTALDAAGGLAPLAAACHGRGFIDNSLCRLRCGGCSSRACIYPRFCWFHWQWPRWPSARTRTIGGGWRCRWRPWGCCGREAGARAGQVNGGTWAGPRLCHILGWECGEMGDERRIDRSVRARPPQAPAGVHGAAWAMEGRGKRTGEV